MRMLTVSSSILVMLTVTQLSLGQNDYTPWSKFGKCSKTCGGGIRSRTRTCLQAQCTGILEQTKSCAAKECPEYSKWSKFGKCSVKCGGGIRTRSRNCLKGTCSGLLEEIINCKINTCGGDRCTDKRSSCPTSTDGCSSKKIRKKCKKSCGVCKEPSTWSEYGPCSVTCGAGLKTRYKESVPQSITCLFSDECPKEWGEWSAWGPCTKTCGPGETTRSRTCSVPNGCVGDWEETKECIAKPCEEETWSECSKFCGGGTRRRYYCNGTECEWQFEGCADGACPEVSCTAFGNNFKRRYNSSHECCLDEHMPSGEQCGQQILEIAGQRRIIGGVAAVEDQWPWMVAVGMAGSGFCAGSIISTKFILSAAHCFAFDFGDPRDVSNWRIYAGILKLTQFQSNLGLKIKKTYIHPDYTYPIADIAIAELEKELTFTPSIQPICLPHGEVTPEEATCIVAGWGVSTVPDTVTNALQELAISNFDPNVCVYGYGQHESLKNNVPFLKDNKGYICAGSLTKKIDSCSGDSGGPLVCQRCNSCSWYIAGVVSFGPNPCALIGVPGVYSKVLYYEDWIFSTTNMKRHSLSCSNS